MKPKKLTWLFAVLLWLAGSSTGWSFYNPSTGRWLSRDPVQERGGLNINGFLGNDPVQAVDRNGLWGYLDHRWMIQLSFARAQFSVDPTLNPVCRARMTDLIDQASFLQDTTLPAVDRNEMHYTRALKGPKNPESEVDRLLADGAYKTYLDVQIRELHDRLHDPDAWGACRQSLAALGRLTHAWQDFYAHAIRRDHQGGRENSIYDGWGAWSASPAVTGDPGDRRNFWPSSFDAFSRYGEHPGFGVEPLTRYSPEFYARSRAALEYVTLEYKWWFLGPWLARCKCLCEGGRLGDVGLSRSGATY